MIQASAREPLKATGNFRMMQRAISELRRGEALRLVSADGSVHLLRTVEGLEHDSLAEMHNRSSGFCALLLSPTRARFLGLETGAAIAVDATAMKLDEIEKLANPLASERRKLAAPLLSLSLPASVPEAAVALAKIARLLPALLLVEENHPTPDTVSVTVTEALDFAEEAPHHLTRVADASVPLYDSEKTRIVAFRPADGSREHLAIIVGEPESDEAPLVRLHSECFTGDLLGSLRCDCGDQLRGSIAMMEKAGSGVLLYLAQEGRGIGLVNKLRAYHLQDMGADTLDANQELGYEADERLFKPAVEILHQLGLKKLRLLTNNPEKVAAFDPYDIDVIERVPHYFPSNGHNEDYLQTKALRFGHFL